MIRSSSNLRLQATLEVASSPPSKAVQHRCDECLGERRLSNAELSAEDDDHARFARMSCEANAGDPGMKIITPTEVNPLTHPFQSLSICLCCIHEYQ